MLEDLVFRNKMQTTAQNRTFHYGSLQRTNAFCVEKKQRFQTAHFFNPSKNCCQFLSGLGNLKSNRHIVDTTSRQNTMLLDYQDQDQDGGFQGNWLTSQFSSVWSWINRAQQHLSKGIQHADYKQRRCMTSSIKITVINMDEITTSATKFVKSGFEMYPLSASTLSKE